MVTFSETSQQTYIDQYIATFLNIAKKKKKRLLQTIFFYSDIFRVFSDILQTSPKPKFPVVKRLGENLFLLKQLPCLTPLRQVQIWCKQIYLIMYVNQIQKNISFPLSFIDLIHLNGRLVFIVTTFSFLFVCFNFFQRSNFSY